MASTLKLLASSQVASANTDTTIYTVGVGKSAKIQTISLHNITNVGLTLTLSLVPSGGSVDSTHRVLSKYVLNGYDTISHEDILACLRGVVIDAGTYLSVTSDAAASLNYLLTGVELS